MLYIYPISFKQRETIRIFPLLKRAWFISAGDQGQICSRNQIKERNSWGRKLFLSVVTANYSGISLSAVPDDADSSVFGEGDTATTTAAFIVDDCPSSDFT